MTLDEAIEQCDRISHKFWDRKEGQDHRQMKNWLAELKRRRATWPTFNEACNAVDIYMKDGKSYHYHDLVHIGYLVLGNTAFLGVSVFNDHSVSDKLYSIADIDSFAYNKVQEDK